MGNSKHSTVSTAKTINLQEASKTRNSKVPSSNRRLSSETDFAVMNADMQLGRLRSVDFRLGNVLLHSGALSSARTDGFLLDSLKSWDTFLFARTCGKNHKGFGFTCKITFGTEDVEQGKYIVEQMSKPKKKYEGFEDSPLDVYDSTPEFQRQVLGLVFKKRDSDKEVALQGIDLFSIQGLVGSILIKDDWTSGYEIRNNQDEVSFLAQRFNRISGGLEFQIYTASQVDIKVCIGTLVRLEESKFILKIYSPCPPSIKSLMISFTIFIMYLWSR